jgi:hypothetical protein
MFYLVQQDSDGQFPAGRAVVISSHSTAAEAIIARERRRSVLRQLGRSHDNLELVVLRADGSVVSRDPFGRDARAKGRPTMLWRLGGRDGTCARAMLVPNARTCTLVWWFDDIRLFARELPGWDEALVAAEKLREEFQARDFIDIADGDRISDVSSVS